MFRFPKFLTACFAVALIAGTSPANASPYSVELSLNGSPVTREINPIKEPLIGGGGFVDEIQYYDGGDTLELSPQQRSLNFYLFENGNDQLSVTMILSAGSSSIGGSQIGITSTGLAGQGVTTLLYDDPGDFLLPWDDVTGTTTSFFQQSASNDTDGMILGYLPSAADSSWSLTFDISVIGGFNQVAIWYLLNPFVSEDTAGIWVLGDSIPPNVTNTVTFSRTGEAVEIPATTSAILPLAFLGLLAMRRRNG